MRKKDSLYKYSKKNISAVQFKLLTDIIWGWDLVNLNWIMSEDEAELITSKYQDNIIPLYTIRNSVTEEKIEMLTAYAMVVNVDMTVEELIENERKCSHVEYWDNNGKLHYLSEVAIHKDFRSNGKSFIRLMKEVMIYCKSNNIETLYTTAVSDDSRLILANKRLKESVRLLAEKEEGRKVYEIMINEINLEGRYNERTVK